LTDLHRYGEPVESVFQLLGERENDMTANLGWALSHVTPFLNEVLRILRIDAPAGDVSINLQEREEGGGITDVELYSRAGIYVVIEAKRGWILPTEYQLQCYARRKQFADSEIPIKRIVVLSECSLEYVTAHDYPVAIEGIPVVTLSWRRIVMCATDVENRCSYTGRRLIRELVKYLGRTTTMQHHKSNLAYVVSLASAKPIRWDISWIDIVKEKRRYFHPLGSGGWPKEPPNYIAFRYGGRLRSIHHIEDYAVINRPHESIPEIPADEEWSDHFLYVLGPPFGPGRDVLTGAIWPNGRVWCMLDTLFTCETIAAARDLTQQRLAVGTTTSK